MLAHCWKCNKEVKDLNNKISFRAQCTHCGFDLHTCTNCKNYSPGKPNDCLIPGTEWVKDRETMNFCEDFSVRTPASSLDKSNSNAKKNFKSLFKDD